MNARSRSSALAHEAAGAAQTETEPVRQLAHFIDGAMVDPVSAAWLDDVDPATGTVCARVPDGDKRDVERAVESAARAFPAWSATPAAERSRILLRLAERIEANLETLARTESVDTGKPISLARRVDIPRSVENLRFFAGAVLHTRSETHSTDGSALNYTLRQPRGVAGCISPWNLPLYLLTWKIAPALATGNTVVAKPSEITPMTAHLLAELSRDAGVPRGVLNVVHGLGPRVGAAVVSHPDVPTISFTGGTRTGAEIAREAGPMFKRLSLELGGKNPTIVFADADLEEALAGAVRAAFTNQGQICLCGSRIFVERPLYDRFVRGVVARARALRVGDPLDETTEHGALVSEAHFEKVASYVDLAGAEGGTILCGGERPAELPERCAGGWFLLPTVITDLEPACRTNQEEIFGPVATIMPFDTEAEVIEHANGTNYGLAASIWTGDVDRAHRVAAQVQAGTVWVNCWMLRDLRVPFGGMKHSGVGREGGEDALRFFTEPKNVCVKIMPEGTEARRHEGGRP